MILGIGVDVVHIRRIERWLTVPGLPERFFHPEELASALSRGASAAHQFAIEIKNDNRLVGNFGIRKNQKSINSAEIGFELDPNYWHNGYMHEALRAIIEFGIKVIKLNHFYAFCNPNNQRAINLLIKIGFKVTAEIFQENRNRKEVELELQI